MSSTTIAIVGNPNSGKTAIFNTLSGLRQKTGNFAGVTVERKSTIVNWGTSKIQLVDLPGTYSLYPLTEDEHVVAKVLLNKEDPDHPDGILYIADPTQLERHLLLYSQIRDLGIPVILGLSMSDVAQEKGIKVDVKQLEKKLGHPVLSFSSRKSEGIDQLKNQIQSFQNVKPASTVYPLTGIEKSLIGSVDNDQADYAQLVIAHHATEFQFLPDNLSNKIAVKKKSIGFDNMASQVEETLYRFGWIEPLLKEVLTNEMDYLESKSLKADRWLTHKIIGPLFFIFILFMIFQAIYTLAEAPMDWIEGFFGTTGGWIGDLLPKGMLSDLITQGILPGLAGVFVFIPQIAILFFLLGILEESGYLSRAIFLFDRFFQRLGMNGRSLVALVSASACAIPAIMSTRSIRSKKERLLTILVTPLISCSARTPVYIVLVGFIVTGDKLWGVVSLQGLAFLGFYLLGIVAVILFSLILKLVMDSREPSFLMLELPDYKWPNFQDVLLNTWLKVKSFIVEAGKIIFLISIVLWLLASYGPSNRQYSIDQTMEAAKTSGQFSEDELTDLRMAAELETSYAGILGKTIEPVIEPLGYDWKIGIALITSFAAREVFVSTMATIYSMASEEDEATISDRMSLEINPATGGPRYTPATALSLVVFYVFAMQCMSTLAVVRKETGSWLYPMIQLIGMTALAYVTAFLAYQLLS